MNASRVRNFLIRVLSLCLAFSFLAAPTPSLAGAETGTETMSFPLHYELFVDCANGGAGENVVIDGTAQYVIHFTNDPSGGFHSNAQLVWYGKGVGTITGNKYQGSSENRWGYNANPGYEETVINTLQLIGQGQAGDFLVQYAAHIKILADGTIVVWNDVYNITCR